MSYFKKQGNGLEIIGIAKDGRVIYGPNTKN
jgi:hypothetical protein